MILYEENFFCSFVLLVGMESFSGVHTPMEHCSKNSVDNYAQETQGEEEMQLIGANSIRYCTKTVSILFAPVFVVLANALVPVRINVSSNGWIPCLDRTHIISVKRSIPNWIGLRDTD